MRTQMQRTGMILSLVMLCIVSIVGIGAQTAPAFTDLSIYSIKYIGTDAAKETAIYTLIDQQETLLLLTNESAGIYLEQESDIATLRISIGSVYQEASLECMYMNNGKLEWEGTTYPLHTGTNTLFIRKITTNYVVLTIKGSAQVKDIALGGMVRSHDSSLLSYTAKGSLFTNEVNLSDHDVTTTVEFKNYYLTPNTLRIDANGDIEYLKLWGKCAAKLRIIAINNEGKKILLQENINGNQFSDQAYTIIPLTNRGGLDTIASLELQFYEFSASSISIGELEVWGKGNRETYSLNAKKGMITEQSSYAVDGIDLIDMHDVQKIQMKLYAGSETHVYINQVYAGIVNDGEETVLALSADYFTDGFNLIEYYTPASTVSISSCSFTIVKGNGKLAYDSSVKEYNDQVLDTYSAMKPGYIRFKGTRDIDTIRIYHTASTKDTLSVWIDGVSVYSGLFTQPLNGYMDIAVPGNVSVSRMVKVETTAALGEIEVYGSVITPLAINTSTTSAPLTNVKPGGYSEIIEKRKAQIQNEINTQNLQALNGSTAVNEVSLLEQAYAFITNITAMNNGTNSGSTSTGSENDYTAAILKPLDTVVYTLIDTQSERVSTYPVISTAVVTAIKESMKTRADSNRYELTAIVDGTVKENNRYLTLTNTGNAYTGIECNGEKYSFVNGIADIPLALVKGYTTVKILTKDLANETATRWISVEHKPNDLAINGKPRLVKEDGKYYLVFETTGDAVYYKSYNGKGYVFTNQSKILYDMANAKQITVEIQAVDTAGNRKTYAEKMDTERTPPTITSVVYPTVWVKTAPMIQVKATDGSGIAKVELVIGGISYSETLFNGAKQIDAAIQAPWLGDGKHDVHLLVWDRLGNAAHKLIELFYDNTSAQINVGEPEQFTNQNTYPFTFTVMEYSIAKLKINGIDQNLASVVTNAVPLADGTLDGKGVKTVYDCKSQIITDQETSYSVSILVEDKAGNVSSTGFTIIKDTVGPKITVYNSDEAYAQKTIELKGEVIDTSPVQVTVNGTAAIVTKDGSKWLFSKQIEFSAIGVNVFDIKATDISGNSTTITWEGIWDSEAPGAVLDLAVSYNGTTTLLTWKKPSDDTKSYTILRTLRYYNNSGVMPLPAGFINEATFTSLKEEYSDSDAAIAVLEGSLFSVAEYQVSAIDRAGNVSVPSGVTNKTVGTITQAGGTVQSTIDESLSLVVPANAVESDTIVAIGVETPAINQPYAMNVSLEPAGTEFKEFVSLEIDLDQQKIENPEVMLEELDQKNLVLYYFDEEYGQWIQEFGGYREIQDGTTVKKLFQGYVQHFSEYTISLPDYSPQIKKGIVSSNSYFQNSNEYIDEGSGTLYIQRQEAVIQSGNNLSFTLTGLYSSNGVEIGLAPVNHYFGYMIPYIKNGFLYLENGGRYRMLWNDKGMCYHNEDIYFEGRYNKEKKQITVYFKDGKKYIFDAAGYFKKEPVSTPSLARSIHTEDDHPYIPPLTTPPDPPNSFNVNTIVPLISIVDRTGNNSITFSYTATTITKNQTQTSVKKNASFILKDIQVFCNSTDLLAPLKKYTVSQSTAKTIYSYFMGSYEGVSYYYSVSTPTITGITETVGTNTLPLVSMETLSLYDLSLIKNRRKVMITPSFADQSKALLHKVTIANDEGGRSEYMFKNESFGDAGTRDIVQEKKSMTVDGNVLSKITFEYIKAAVSTNGAFVGCSMQYFDAAGTLVKKVYKEIYDTVTKRIVSDKNNNPLTEEVMFKGKGVNGFFSVDKKKMVSAVGEYYFLNKDIMIHEQLTMFDVLTKMQENKVFTGYSITKSGTSILLAKTGTKESITINEDKLIFTYEHITYEPKVDPNDWEGKGTPPSGNRIIGRTMVSRPHTLLVLYKGKETIGQNEFQVRVIIEVLGDKSVVFTEYVPIELKEYNLSIGYSGNIEHILNYDLVGEKKLISAEDYDYDAYGNVSCYQKNNIITEYSYGIENDFKSTPLPANPSLFIYPQAIWRYVQGGTTKTAIAYDFDTGMGVPTAVYDLGNVPINTDLTDSVTVEDLKKQTQRVTSYSYDDAGRVTAVINPDKGTIAYTYPTNYHRPATITQKTANGIVLTTMSMNYAVLGDRLLSTIKGNDPSITTDDYTTSFSYYQDGDIKEITNDALMYLSDAALDNRAMKVRYLFGANTVGYIRYAESGSGSIESDLTAVNTIFEATFTTPQPAAAVQTALKSFLDSLIAKGKVQDIAEVLFYTFDGLGHIIGITQYNYEQNDTASTEMVWKPYTVTITYDSVGNRTAITFPSKKELLRDFDALGRIVAVAIKGYDPEANSTTPPLVTKQLYTIDYAWKLLGTDLRYVSTYTQQPYSSADADKYTIVNYQDNNGYTHLFERYKGTTLLTHKATTYNPDLQLIKESELADFAPALPVEIRYSYTAFNELFETLLQESEYREPNIATITGSTLDSSFTTSFNAKKRLENSYTNLGQPLQQTQDIRMNGSDTKFGITLDYDEFGNPIKKTYPDSSYETVGYDSSGNAVLSTDVDEQTSYVLYDKAGRVYAKRNKNEQSWTYILYGLRGPAAEVTKEGLLIGIGVLYEPLSVANRYKKGSGDITLHPTLWQNNSTRYYYDQLGRVHKVIDKKGNIVNYFYDDDGKIIKQTYTWKEGSSITTIDTQKVTYSLLGEVLSTTDKNGVTTSVHYDTWRRVHQELVTNTFGNDTRIVREYAYTLHGLVSTIYTYEDGKKVVVASYTYDGLGRVLTQTDEFGVTTALEYNPDGSVKKLTKTGKDETITSRVTYDRLGNTTSLTNGTVTTYAAQGFLTDTVSGKSLFASAEVFPYDTIDASTPDAVYNGVQVTYYKNAKEMLYTKKADGSIAFLDIQHNIAAGTTTTTVMMTHLFKTIDIYRTFLNNPSGVTPKTNSYEYVKTVFDPYGLVVSSENDEAMKSEFSYNHYYELTAKKDTVLGATFTQNYLWDSTGMLAYKSLPTVSSAPDPDYMEYKYDAKKNLTGVTGVITAVSYNSFMQVAGIEYANSITEEFNYDSRFRLSKHTLKTIGQEVYTAVYTYENGKIKEIKEFGKAAITTFEKQLQEVTKNYVYTGLGRLKTAAYTMPVTQKKDMGAGASTRTIQYISGDYYPDTKKEGNNSHLSGGNVAVPFDTAPSNQQKPTWGTDDTMTKDSNGNTVLNTTWAVDFGNNAIVITCGVATVKGIKEAGIGLQGSKPEMTQSDWDVILAKLDKTNFTVYVQKSKDSLWIKALPDDTTYGYEWIVKNGMVTIRFNGSHDLYQVKLQYNSDMKKIVFAKQTTSASTVDVSLVMTSSSKDAKVFPTGKGYLVVSSGSITLNYQYDANGNMIQETRTYADGTVQTRNFTYSSVTNRLKTDDEKVYIYDILGNQIGTRSINGSTSEEFTYNLKGKLVEYTAKQGLTEIVAKGIYKYDALGNRVYREVISKEDSGSYLMLYDEKGMKSYEKQTRGSTSDEFYFIGLTLLPIVSVKGRKFTKKQKYTNDGQSIGVIAAIDTDASEFRYYNYLSTLRFTADGTGRLTGAYDSLPYGEEAYSFDTATSMTKSTIFATHEKDVESGLYYARNRMYDSASGRFTSVDPIKDGLNWFLYCDADPVNAFDPTGLYDMDYDESGNPVAVPDDNEAASSGEGVDLHSASGRLNDLLGGFTPDPNRAGKASKAEKELWRIARDYAKDRVNKAKELAKLQGDEITEEELQEIYEEAYDSIQELYDAYTDAIINYIKNSTPVVNQATKVAQSVVNRMKKIAKAYGEELTEEELQEIYQEAYDAEVARILDDLNTGIDNFVLEILRIQTGQSQNTTTMFSTAFVTGNTKNAAGQVNGVTATYLNFVYQDGKLKVSIVDVVITERNATLGTQGPEFPALPGTYHVRYITGATYELWVYDHPESGIMVHITEQGILEGCIPIGYENNYALSIEDILLDAVSNGGEFVIELAVIDLR